MKHHYLAALSALTLLPVSHANADEKLNTLLSELKPALFEPGVISTEQFEYGSSLAPNGQQFAFSKALVHFQQSTLVMSEKRNGQWTEPQVMPFSGKWHDSNPYFSKDGQHFYFTSNRPVPDKPKYDAKMWQVSLDKNGFGKPRLVPGGINGNFTVVYPTLDSHKNIYFCSYIEEGKGGLDLYLSGYSEQGYQKPVPITELNTPSNDADPELTQDGKLLFFTSTRPGGLGHYDLHVSVKQKSGKWGKPINLGDKINSPAMDSDPILSVDGNTLFFSSDRAQQFSAVKNYRDLKQRQNQVQNGLMNIYTVDIAELKQYLVKKASL